MWQALGDHVALLTRLGTVWELVDRMAGYSRYSELAAAFSHILAARDAHPDRRA